MAAPEPKLAITCDGQTADDVHNGHAGAVATRLQRHVTGGSRALSQGQARETEKHGTLFKLRTLFFSLTAMLILLLALQDPICCDRMFTSELLPTPATQQSLQPAPIPLSQQRDAFGENDGLMSAAAHATDAVAKTANTETMTVSDSAAMAPIAVQIAATAKADAPVSSSGGIEAIKSDATSTLTALSQSGFVKLAWTGEVLDENATQWECVEDRRRRLTWEVKKNDGGMRDRDHSYSWLSELGGQKDGIDNGGRCKGGISCDTLSYARAMNDQKLCGYSDWRLPTKKELETLVTYSDNSGQATIDKTYFPEAIPSWYWTASVHPKREDLAWYVLFRNGIALNDLKERPKHIRLVRGEIRPR